MTDSSAAGQWSSSPETFADTLQELKQTGCMVLVVEDEGAAAHEGCDRLLGSDDAADRRRLFVQTDAATSSRLTAAGRRDRTTERVARLRTASRTAAATADGASGGPGAASAVASTVDDLAADVRDAVRALEPATGYEAGQLRVCVDALGDMVAATDTADATGFVADVRALVDEHDGLGHVHVTQETPGEAAEALLPQMDAVVEVAGDDEDPRHRWHLPGESLTSAWFELERP